MLELDHKEGWVPKNWCFQTVGLEKILESPLLCKEIKPVNAKGNQCWIFIGRMILKLKLQSFGHLMWRADSMEKTLTLGKIEGKGEGAAEDETVRWHHQLNGYEFEQIPGDSRKQRSLVCCSPWGQKSRTWLSDWTITKEKGDSGKMVVHLWNYMFLNFSEFPHIWATR